MLYWCWHDSIVSKTESGSRHTILLFTTLVTNLTSESVWLYRLGYSWLNAWRTPLVSFDSFGIKPSVLITRRGILDRFTLSNPICRWQEYSPYVQRSNIITVSGESTLLTIKPPASLVFRQIVRRIHPFSMTAALRAKLTRSPWINRLNFQPNKRGFVFEFIK